MEEKEKLRRRKEEEKREGKKEGQEWMEVSLSLRISMYKEIN